MKIILIAALMVAVIISPADAGYLSIKSAGDNPSFQIAIDGKQVPIYPDGSSPVIITGNTAVISVIYPGGIYEVEIITRGNTVYSVPYGAQVTPVGHNDPQPEQPKEKDSNKDGSKHKKGGKK